MLCFEKTQFEVWFLFSCLREISVANKLSCECCDLAQIDVHDWNNFSGRNFDEEIFADFLTKIYIETINTIHAHDTDLPLVWISGPFLCLTYHWVGVWEELFQLVKEALVLHHGSIDVMQLGHTDGCCLPHIRIFIFETLAQGLTQVLSDLVHTDTSHCAHSQGTDQGIGVLTVLRYKGNYV